MSMPSFLYTAGKEPYAASLMGDLHLADILPKKILPILTRPCDKQTVSAGRTSFGIWMTVLFAAM